MSSMGTVLFSKGRSNSDNEDQDQNQDELDEQLLTKAYDRALRNAKVEVAKRIAESTNTLHLKEDPHSKPFKLEQSKKSKKSKKREAGEHPWKVGGNCRAVYSDDNLEYEAVIMKFHSDDVVTVRFIGYGNEETVPLSSLSKSLGPQVAADQRRIAMQDNVESMFKEKTKIKDETKRKFGKNKRNKTTNSGFDSTEFGKLPFCPIPPPGIPLCPEGLATSGFMGLGGLPDEAQMDGALTSMLVSWYLSGYYTGYYQGLQKKDKSKQKSRKE